MTEIQDQIAKIRWDCRRGMLELDYILEQYLKYGLEQLAPDELQEFQQFLENQDPDLFAWFLGYDAPKDEFDQRWVKRVMSAQRESG